jgi:hypothetical protein
MSAREPVRRSRNFFAAEKACSFNVRGFYSQNAADAISGVNDRAVNPESKKKRRR